MLGSPWGRPVPEFWLSLPPASGALILIKPHPAGLTQFFCGGLGFRRPC